MLDDYRLHIDVPLGLSQETAIKKAQAILNAMRRIPWHDYGMDDSTGHLFQVRLGNDSDRGRKNYLEINENGHAANGKQPLFEPSNET